MPLGMTTASGSIIIPLMAHEFPCSINGMTKASELLRAEYDRNFHIHYFFLRKSHTDLFLWYTGVRESIMRLGFVLFLQVPEPKI